MPKAKSQPQNSTEYLAYDDVLKEYVWKCSARQCPNPAVIRVYGHNGKVTVSIAECQKCKFGGETSIKGAYCCNFGKGDEHNGSSI